MAMENPNIRGAMVEAMEFQEWSERFHVYGVPKTVVNDKVQFEGAVPEKIFLDHVLKAVNGKR